MAVTDKIGEIKNRQIKEQEIRQENEGTGKRLKHGGRRYASGVVCDQRCEKTN